MVTVFHWSSDSDKREKWQTKHAKKNYDPITIAQKNRAPKYMQTSTVTFQEQGVFSLISASIVGFGSARGAREQKYEDRENRHSEGHTYYWVLQRKSL